jgi:hypothetical protein
MRGAPILRHQPLHPVLVHDPAPLVVTGAGESHLPARRRQDAQLLGKSKQTDTPVIDDLCWGHGGGSLFCGRNHRAHRHTAVPTKWWTCNLNPPGQAELHGRTRPERSSCEEPRHWPVRDRLCVPSTTTRRDGNDHHDTHHRPRFACSAASTRTRTSTSAQRSTSSAGCAQLGRDGRRRRRGDRVLGCRFGRHLTAAGVDVREVMRPNRQHRAATASPTRPTRSARPSSVGR